MSESYQITLRTETHRQKGAVALMRAPLGYVLKLSEETRTEAQNRLIHPLIRDVTDNYKLEYGPEKKTMTQHEWRRFFVVGVKLEKGDEVKMVRMPDRHDVIDVTESSSRALNKRMFSELIEYVIWFGQTHGKPALPRSIADARAYTQPLNNKKAG